MSRPLPRRSIACEGRDIPAIAVVGPSGVGKSLLATQIALTIARAEGGPIVLLVDGDVYSRGLTSRIEGMMGITCGYLHDVIVGRNPKVAPMDLAAIPSKPEAWELRDQEGRVFFLPSARKDAVNPFDSVATTNLLGLQDLLCQSITNAASCCGAGLAVIDTASIPEPCGAVFASVCDLMILVGSENKTRTVIEEHRHRLEEFGLSVEKLHVEIVFNKLDPNSVEGISAARPLKCYAIPEFSALSWQEEVVIAEEERNEGEKKKGEKGRKDRKDKKGSKGKRKTTEAFADRIALDTCLVDILKRILRVKYPEVVPPWIVVLPADCRTLTKKIKESPPRLIRFLVKRSVSPTLVGVAGLVFLFFSISNWKVFHATAARGLALPVLALVVGFILFLGSIWLFLRLHDHWIIGRALEKEDPGPILVFLTLTPRRIHRTPPETRRKILKRKVRSFRRTCAVLSRAVERPRARAPEVPLNPPEPGGRAETIGEEERN